MPMDYAEEGKGRDPKALANFVAKRGAMPKGKDEDAEGGAEVECPECGHKFEVKE